VTKSILPDLQKGLEAYLEERIEQWRRQPENARQPTLPATTAGKANARAIVRELRWPKDHVQHVYNKPELKSAINAAALEQGLKPLARDEDTGVEKAVADKMRRTERRSGDLAKTVAEQAAVIESQRRTIDGLREQIRIFEETGQVLRTAPVRP
jgi:hypothetical protein